jgi:peroxiredoxin
VFVLSAFAATPRAETAAVPPGGNDIFLRDGAGRSVPLSTITAQHRFTVVVFYSSSCPCFAAHVQRLGSLSAELGKRDVAFVGVDSERHAASEPSPPAEAAPGVPLLRDEGGTLARRLCARFATESFVIDRAGEVRYQGGVDDDRKELKPNAKMYLRDALLGLLRSDMPRHQTAKALGCALRLL